MSIIVTKDPADLVWPDDFINKIICGDCLEILPRIPDGAVDLVVTDPPWRATASRITHRRIGDKRGVAPCNLSQSLSYGDIGHFDLNALRLAYQKCSGDMLVLCGFIELPEVIGVMEKYRGVLVWHNTRPTPIPGSLKFRDIAFIVWGGATTTVTEGRSWDSCLFSYPSPQAGCMATERILKADGTTAHPAQEPIRLFSRILTPTQGTVLDPYLGSGTTAVAAKQLGRKFIGIEINMDYCRIAEDRLRQEELF